MEGKARRDLNFPERIRGNDQENLGKISEAENKAKKNERLFLKWCRWQGREKYDLWRLKRKIWEEKNNVSWGLSS